MVAKKFILKEEVQEKMLAGVEKLKNAVCVTLGAGGLNVAIHKQFDYPEMTKDGITVADRMSLLDEEEDVGLQMVKNASKQTVIEAGDGTTSCISLAHALYHNGLATLNGQICTINKLKDCLIKSRDTTFKFLDSITTKIKSEKDTYNIAFTSANGDKTIAKMVTEAYSEMGTDGTIELVNSRTPNCRIKYHKGYKFKSGFLSTAFVNVPQRMTTEFRNAYVLLYDGFVESTAPLVAFFNKAVNEGRSVLIIANDYADTVINTLIHNAKNKTLSVCVVRAPYYASQRTEVLHDLAVLTGGRVMTPRIDDGLEKAIEKTGVAKKIIVNGVNTTIIDGNYDTKELNNRIESIQHSIQTEDPDINDMYNKKRIAKMTKGVCTIEIGGETSTEIVERSARALDAMLAVKASLEEGIIAGGGVPLLFVNDYFNKQEISKDDREIIKRIFIKSLQAPFRQIISNAGGNEDYILNTVLHKNKKSNLAEYIGYDVVEKDFVNMKERGIIDPVKVTKCAIKNAVSVVIMMLSTGCILSDVLPDPMVQQSPPLS